MNDSRDDTDVSSMAEPLEKKKQEVKITYRQSKPWELLYILFDNEIEHDGRSSNVVRSYKERDSDGMGMLESYYHIQQRGANVA